VQLLLEQEDEQAELHHRLVGVQKQRVLPVLYLDKLEHQKLINELLQLQQQFLQEMMMEL
jgi:hypothetical protein